MGRAGSSMSLGIVTGGCPAAKWVWHTPVITTQLSTFGLKPLRAALVIVLPKLGWGSDVETIVPSTCILCHVQVLGLIPVLCKTNCQCAAGTSPPVSVGI